MRKAGILAAAGIVQSNKLMGRLATIFTTRPPTRPPVAILYSLSQEIHDQTLDRDVSYAHATPHGKNLAFTYLAGKLLQQPLLNLWVPLDPCGTTAPGLEVVVTNHRRLLEVSGEPADTIPVERVGLDEQAVRLGKSNPLVRGFLGAIRAQGGTPGFKVKTGTSDMNVVASGGWECPMLAYGPGDSSLDHTPREHIDLDEYGRAIDVLTAVLEGL